MVSKVRISVDCICDLPRKMWKELDVSMMHFYIMTDEGRFRDIFELNAECMIDYLENGKEAKSSSAPVEEYRTYFLDIRKKFEDTVIIHISAAKHVSESYNSACEAAKTMKDVYVIDSGQLSGGMCFMAMTAAEMAKAGADYELIISELNRMRDKICTSFIVDTTNHLYLNGKINKNVMKICSQFSLHPILKLTDSSMKATSLCIGSPKFYAKTYIRKMVKKPESIDPEVVFLISAGCSYEYLEYIKQEIQKYIKCQRLIVNSASATVTSNCGPGTFGVLFMRK